MDRVSKGWSSSADRFAVAREGSGADADISILLPVYNQADTVAEAVQSVLGQTDVEAEIIISDDASTDATWDVVQSTLRDTPTTHRVVVRRGRTRLRRDHQALLTDAAASDLVLNAHGDDVSEPHRARELVAQLRQPGVALVGSRATVVDEMAVRPRPTPAPSTGVITVPRAELVTRPGELVGALIGWRRSAMSPFPRLDTSFAACLHDQILPFRAGLVGSVRVIERPLVRRRFHLESWSKSMWDMRSADAGAVGSGLYHLTTYRAMRRDLDTAAERGLVDAAEADDLRARIAEQQTILQERVLDAHEHLVNEGRSALWVTDRELNAAWRGDLFAAFERNAAVSRLIVRLRMTSQRLAAATRHARPGRPQARSSSSSPSPSTTTRPAG